MGGFRSRSEQAEKQDDARLPVSGHCTVRDVPVATRLTNGPNGGTPICVPVRVVTDDAIRTYHDFVSRLLQSAEAVEA
jgi:hypothetical protein